MQKQTSPIQKSRISSASGDAQHSLFKAVPIQAPRREREGYYTFLFFFLSSFCFFIPSWGQSQVVQRRPYADYRKYHLGFHVGIHSQDLTVLNRGAYPDGFSFPYIQYAETAHYKPGFSVGMIANYSPTLNIDLRLSPTLHFGERSITFSDLHDHIEELNLRSNLLEVPLSVKFSALRLNNIRPYFTTGAMVSFQIGQKEKDVLAFKWFDPGVLFSVGCDFYLDYFKLSPELRFSFGVSDILQHERPHIAEDSSIRYTHLLKSLYSRMIMLTFNFE